MRRIRIVLSALLLVTVMSGYVCAADRSGLEAGVKMWFNDWIHDDPRYGSFTSDTAVMIGPAVRANLGSRAFLEVSYLASASNYQFSVPVVFDNTERHDLDLAAGYRIIPEFSLLAGYKNSQFNLNVTSTEFTVSGPILGIRADLPMDPYLDFYFGSNYLFTRYKDHGPGGIYEDSPGWTFELGFKYSLTREFTGSFGYKYETNTGNDSNVQDSFSGITLSGMIAF